MAERSVGLLLILFVLSTCAGCGSNGNSTPPPPTQQAPAITSASSATWVQGTAGSFTVTATGTPTPTITESGAFPGGVTFNGNVLNGTPTTTGTFPITFTASNGVSPNAAQNFTLTVNAPATHLAITTTLLPSGQVNAAYSQELTATGGVSPYTWSLIGSLPAGLSLNGAGVISGTPSGLAGTSNFTVTVTDSAAATATANLAITINGVTPLTITTTSLPNGSVGTPYNQSLTATGGIAPYSWQVPDLPAGLSSSSTGTIFGVPSAVGTSTFTVTVTDSENPPSSVNANLSITIGAQVGCTNNASFNGSYAAVIQGPLVGWLGSFSTDGNGHLTGQMDEVMMRTNNGIIAGPESFTGTYCVTSNNLGTIIISSNAGTKVLAFSLSSDANGYAISFDTSQGPNNDLYSVSLNGNQGSGLLRKRLLTTFSTNTVKGTFVFGFGGVQGNQDNTLNRQAMAGVINSDGNGNFCSSGITCEFDRNDFQSGIVTGTLSPSTYSVASNGRGTAMLVASGVGTINLVFYIVSPTEILAMVEPVGQSPVGSLISGQMLATNSNFSNATLNGVSVIGLQGLNGGTTPEAQAGLFTASGGSFTMSLDDNVGGATNTLNLSGHYTVSANGRVTFSNVVGGSGGSSPVFYLIDSNHAFVIGTSPSVDFGMLQPQTGDNFTAASLSGTFAGGSEPPDNSSVSEEVNSVSFDGNGSINGTSDQVNNAVPSSSAVTGTYTVSSGGRVVLNGQSGKQEAIIYIISPTQFVLLTTNSNANPYLIDFKQ
jgi:hypothetical protein